MYDAHLDAMQFYQLFELYFEETKNSVDSRIAVCEAISGKGGKEEIKGALNILNSDKYT